MGKPKAKERRKVKSNTRPQANGLPSIKGTVAQLGSEPAPQASIPALDGVCYG